jgi:hypothetical protein
MRPFRVRRTCRAYVRVAAASCVVGHVRRGCGERRMARARAMGVVVRRRRCCALLRAAQVLRRSRSRSACLTRGRRGRSCARAQSPLASRVVCLLLAGRRRGWMLGECLCVAMTRGHLGFFFSEVTIFFDVLSSLMSRWTTKRACIHSTALTSSHHIRRKSDSLSCACCSSELTTSRSSPPATYSRTST